MGEPQAPMLCYPRAPSADLPPFGNPPLRSMPARPRLSTVQRSFRIQLDTSWQRIYNSRGVISRARPSVDATAILPLSGPITRFKIAQAGGAGCGKYKTSGVLARNHYGTKHGLLEITGSRGPGDSRFRRRLLLRRRRRRRLGRRRDRGELREHRVGREFRVGHAHLPGLDLHRDRIGRKALLREHHGERRLGRHFQRARGPAGRAERNRRLRALVQKVSRGTNSSLKKDSYRYPRVTTPTRGGGRYP